MSETPFLWPALRDFRATTVPYHQAVWGKRRGTTADFGWIARSAGFNGGAPPIEERLKFGSEDRLEPASFWKITDSHGFAIRTYQSPVPDGTGQRGLEKHFTSYTCPPLRGTIPMAAIAAALLVESVRLVERLDVHVDSGSPRDASLSPLEAGSVDLLPAVTTVIEQGIEELRQAIDGQEALIDCYSRLLQRARPAVLRASAPLSPAAVVALLLPLDRTLADKVSIAGWIPSGRYQPDAIGDEWDVVVCEPSNRRFEAPPIPIARPNAAAMVATLFAPPISLAPNLSEAPTVIMRAPIALSEPVDPPVSVSRGGVRELLDFAHSKDRNRRFARTGRSGPIEHTAKTALMTALDHMRRELYADLHPDTDKELFEARKSHLQLKANRLKAQATGLDARLDALNWRIE